MICLKNIFLICVPFYKKQFTCFNWWFPNSVILFVSDVCHISCVCITGHKQVFMFNNILQHTVTKCEYSFNLFQKAWPPMHAPFFCFARFSFKPYWFKKKNFSIYLGLNDLTNDGCYPICIYLHPLCNATVSLQVITLIWSYFYLFIYLGTMVLKRRGEGTYTS